jgi:uncharacterized membrane protein YkoI
MRAKRRDVLTLLAAMLALTAGGVAPARDNFAPPPRHFEPLARERLSLAEAVERVRADTGGRVLAAETVRRDGHAVHRIKVLLPSGHVRIVHMDAGGG